MSLLLFSPLLIPLATAAALLLLWRRVTLHAPIALVGSVAGLAAAVALLIEVDRTGYLVAQAGNWPAPFGITIVADRLSAMMVLLAGILSLAATATAAVTAPVQFIQRGLFPVMQVVMLGICGSLLTGDIFNLYVWFEVMLLGSFVLVALAGERFDLEAAVKYTMINLVGSMVFLTAVGLIYGVARSLNLADLHLRFAELQGQRPMLMLLLSGMLLVSFSIKAAVLPFYFWLPASYHTPTPAVIVIFAGLLTKVGIYSLLRVFSLLFPLAGPWYVLLLILAMLTMLSGVLGAMTQFEIRRILAWHSVSQIGYMLVGVALLGASDPAVRRLGTAATLLFIIHHGLVKPTLFLVAGTIEQWRGNSDLKRLGGLADAKTWLAGLFLLAALSLAGLPPLSGFWAKLAVIRAALEGREYLLVAVALAASLLTLISMIKIWNEGFWKPAPEKTSDHKEVPDRSSLPISSHGARGLTAIVALLVLLIVMIGLHPQPWWAIMQRAATQVNHPIGYVEAVIPGMQGSQVTASADAAQKVGLREASR
jgi:multicomponent Na+:H+ antiporter subunit D